MGSGKHTETSQRRECGLRAPLSRQMTGHEPSRSQTPHLLCLCYCVILFELTGDSEWDTDFICARISSSNGSAGRVDLAADVVLQTLLGQLALRRHELGVGRQRQHAQLDGRKGGRKGEHGATILLAVAGGSRRRRSRSRAHVVCVLEDGVEDSSNSECRLDDVRSVASRVNELLLHGHGNHFARHAQRLAAGKENRSGTERRKEKTNKQSKSHHIRRSESGQFIGPRSRPP